MGLKALKKPLSFRPIPMRQQALLQITSLLLLLLGWGDLPSSPGNSQGHSTEGDFCERCTGNREPNQQFLNSDTALQIALLESILEQVNKDEWAHFMNHYPNRNWICHLCNYYNKHSNSNCHICSARKCCNQTAQGQASLAACLAYLIGQLREDGIAHSSPQKRQKRWLCGLCRCFNFDGEYICKECKSGYELRQEYLEKKKVEFMEYINNVIERFKEDQSKECALCLEAKPYDEPNASNCVSPQCVKVHHVCKQCYLTLLKKALTEDKHFLECPFCRSKISISSTLST